jgi:GAF domain-containing protein
MRNDASQITETIHNELEKQLFQLKNLSDISRDLYLATDFKKALKDFLLMAMGNFGVGSGFLLTQGESEDTPRYFLTQGLAGEERAAVHNAGTGFLEDWDGAFCVSDTSPAEQALLRERGISILLPFRIDDASIGLLGLGSKVSEEPFDRNEKELVKILGSNLAVALRNARSFQNIQRLNQRLTEQNARMEAVLDELDRKVYHLKTLFDVSKDIFRSVNIDEILRRFLLLTMGNFGAARGFVSLVEAPFLESTRFESLGYKEDILADRGDFLLNALRRWLEKEEPDGEHLSDLTADQSLWILFALPFRVDDQCVGLLGMGPKIVGGEFSRDDRELLETLVNNLVPALGNARAFENIQKLNLDLRESNRQLKETLEDLRAALRKVEILEGVKSNLSKFVPTAVSRMIDAEPGTDALEARETDVSVLFLDIE